MNDEFEIDGPYASGIGTILSISRHCSNIESCHFKSGWASLLAKEFGGIYWQSESRNLIFIFPVTINSEKHALRALSFWRRVISLSEEWNEKYSGYLYSGDLTSLQDGTDLIREVSHFSDLLVQKDISGVRLLLSEGAAQLIKNYADYLPVAIEAGKITHPAYQYLGMCSREPEELEIYGREFHLGLLKKYFASQRTEKKYIIVHGSPGIGKSTLITKFLSDTKDLYIPIKYRFFESGHADFFVMIFAEILVRLFGVPLNINNIRNIGDTLNLSPEQCKFLESKIIGEGKTLSFSKTKSWEIISAALSYEHLKKKPILFFDDVHWAPDEFFDLARFWHNNNLQIQIVATSRISHSKHKVFEKLYLDGISRNANDLICRKSLSVAQCTEENLSFLYRKCAGNPLFLNELIGIFVTDGFACRNFEGSEIIRHAGISLGISNLVHFNFIRLPQFEKNILAAAASIGEVFSLDLLAKALAKEKKDIIFEIQHFCESGYLRSISNDHYEFTHNIKRTGIYSALDSGKRREIHRRIYETSHYQDNSIEGLSFTARHIFLAEEWNEAYRQNFRLAKLLLRNLKSIAAIEAVSRCIEAARKGRSLTARRKIRLTFLLCKCHFISGKIGSAKKHVREIEASFLKGQFSAEDLREAVSLLTFYYWVTANYARALLIISSIIKDDQMIDRELYATLKIRQIGILSDQGNFDKSNLEIHELLTYLSGTKGGAMGKSIFPMLSALYSLQIRNMAYQNNRLAFLSAVEKIHKLNSDQAISTHKIFSLCYMADGFMNLGEINEAIRYSSLAIKLATENNTNILDSYLHSISGYCRVRRGDEKGIDEIAEAIFEAENAGRVGRLSYYYLLLSRAYVIINSKAGFRRSVAQGLRLAQKNGESWVEKEFLLLAAQKGQPLRSGKTASNVLHMSQRRGRLNAPKSQI